MLRCYSTGPSRRTLRSNIIEHVRVFPRQFMVMPLARMYCIAWANQIFLQELLGLGRYLSQRNG